MKIPPKIRIKSKVNYEIVWQAKIADDDFCLGLCDPQKQIIYLKLGMSDTETIKTFLHEVLHALSAEHGFELPHRTVYALEDAVYKVFKLNKFLK